MNAIELFVIPIFSGIAVALAIMAISHKLKGRDTKKKRTSYLITIKKQLENDMLVFDGIKKDLEKSYIPSYFDTTIYHSFLLSEYYNPEKDAKFVKELQEHLQNIGRHNTALHRISLLGASTAGDPTDLEKSIISNASDFSKGIDEEVIPEIDKLINEKSECCCKNLFNRNKPKEKTEETIDKIKKEEKFP